MGAIGLGGQGRGVLGNFLHCPDVQVVAVCDVDSARCQAAKVAVEAHYAKTGAASGAYKGCSAYSDFRELIARDDIDAVLVATPDHGHVMPVLYAARSRKDVYCEKPLSLTVAEGRAMADALQRHGRVFQLGTQQRSDARFRHACELVRNGRIGRLHTVTVCVPGGRVSDMPKPAPVPPGFDYDLWLGPSPWAPYSPQRVSNAYWYHTSDYSAGFVSGWGVHHIDIAQWGMGTELTGPMEIEGRGVYPRDGLCDAAVNWRVELTYDGGVKVIFIDGGEWVKFEGDAGWVWVSRGGIDAHPKALLKETFGANEVHLYRSNNHARNLVDCVKTRGQTACPIEVAHRSTSICLISEIAMRLRRKLKWDPAREQFPGDDEANRMLSRTMREPWRL